ncbi:replication initiator protein RctB domain-containing protein [Vibrio splendidus]
MIKQERGIYFDTDPDRLKGSVYDFSNVTEEYLVALTTHSCLSNLNLTRLRTLIEFNQKNNADDLWVFSDQLYIQCSELFKMKNNSARGFLSKLKSSKVVEKVDNFETPFKPIFAYRFSTNFERKASVKAKSTAISPTQAEYDALVGHYSNRADAESDPFFSVNSDLVVSGMFDQPNMKVPPLENFLAPSRMGKVNQEPQQQITNIIQLRQPTPMLEHKEHEDSFQLSSDLEAPLSMKTTTVLYKTRTVSSHADGVMTPDDFPLFNALQHLTIMYHKAHELDYLRQEKISTITPIFTRDIFEIMGNLTLRNQSDWDYIDDTLYKIEGNKFSLSAESEFPELSLTGSYNTRRHLFDVEHTKETSRIVGGKSVKRTEVYLLNWNSGVLEAFFNTKFYFLFPADIFRYTGLIHMLYSRARKVMNKRSSIEYDLPKLFELLQYGNVDHATACQSLVKMLIKNLSIPESNIVRSGVSKRTKVQSLYHQLTIGGIRFTVAGKAIHTRKPLLTITTVSDVAAVYMASQPRDKQMKLQSLGFEFSGDGEHNDGSVESQTVDDKYSDVLGNDVGRNAPVMFNNKLSLVSSKLQSRVEVAINRDNLRSIREGALEIRIRSRKFCVLVYVSNATYYFHRYLTEDAFIGMVNDIASLAHASVDETQKRLLNAFNSTSFFELSDGTMTQSLLNTIFDTYAPSVDYSSNIESLHRALVLRVKKLGNMSVYDISTLAEFIVGQLSVDIDQDITPITEKQSSADISKSSVIEDADYKEI